MSFGVCPHQQFTFFDQTCISLELIAPPALVPSLFELSEAPPGFETSPETFPDMSSGFAEL